MLGLRTSRAIPLLWGGRLEQAVLLGWGEEDLALPAKALGRAALLQSCPLELAALACALCPSSPARVLFFQDNTTKPGKGAGPVTELRSVSPVSGAQEGGREGER